MVVLHVQLLGGSQVVRRNDAAISLQPAVQEFLAFLLLNRHRQFCRGTLAGLFWGAAGERQARRCLSTTLWRLRQELEPEGIPPGTFILAAESGDIGFNCQSNYWLDVSAFEEKIGFGLRRPPAEMGPEEAQALEEAAALYTGDLLEGLYSDWVLGHRERLRAQYVRGLIWLMRHYRARQEHDRALACGQKVLEIDPLREEIYREMMRLHAARGERALAVRQYEQCRQALAQELAIEPMAETQALYHRLLSGKGYVPPAQDRPGGPSLPPAGDTQPAPKSGRGRPANLQQALHQLDQAMIGLEEARVQVRQAIHIVNKFVRP
jgi:DNA-binding SARP family transcriptional activator